MNPIFKPVSVGLFVGEIETINIQLLLKDMIIMLLLL